MGPTTPGIFQTFGRSCLNPLGLDSLTNPSSPVCNAPLCPHLFPKVGFQTQPFFSFFSGPATPLATPPHAPRLSSYHGRMSPPSDFGNQTQQLIHRSYELFGSSGQPPDTRHPHPSSSSSSSRVPGHTLSPGYPPP